MVASVEAGELSFGYCRAGGPPLLPVETFAYGGVAAWRVAPRVAPARSAPLEKMVNFSSRYARILSKIGALRAILVKSARYARSNLASGALRASQHSLTEVGVKWFFFPRSARSLTHGSPRRLTMSQLFKLHLPQA